MNVRLEIIIGTVYSYRLQGNVVSALKDAKSIEEAREQPRLRDRVTYRRLSLELTSLTGKLMMLCMDYRSALI